MLEVSSFQRAPFWCQVGALEHQKVQNHQKLKCSENAHYIYQNDALVKLSDEYNFDVILVHWWCIGAPKSVKSSKIKVRKKASHQSAQKSFAPKRAQRAESLVSKRAQRAPYQSARSAHIARIKARRMAQSKRTKRVESPNQSARSA